MGTLFIFEGMRVFSWSTLRDFSVKHADAASETRVWYGIIRRGSFKSPHEIKTKVSSSADPIGDGVTIFNIKGNDYRLIVDIRYQAQIVYILWIGTHAEYDRLSKEDIIKMKA